MLHHEEEEEAEPGRYEEEGRVEEEMMSTNLCRQQGPFQSLRRCLIHQISVPCT